jgi:hypothetical protein
MIELIPIREYTELFTIKEFAEDVKLGCLIPYDGDGYWATETQQSHLCVWDTPKPEWATHVAWYNR